jgi:hypothetical protein
MAVKKKEGKKENRKRREGQETRTKKSKIGNG